MFNAAYFRATCAVLVLLGSASAAPIVDPAQPITQEVFVQPIIVRDNGGGTPSTYFGDATQQAEIMLFIDQIWAQAGINITFLAPTFYNNEFARVGTSAPNPRPDTDLNAIVAAAGSPPESANPLTLNMFLVDIVPGFAFTSENTANGLAFVGANGITQFVGDNLLGSPGGHTVIASVVAHEIGHNLGLGHTADNIANLMSPGGTSDQLTAGQITTALNSTFSIPVTPVPEPSTVFAFGVVVMGLGYTVRRRMAA